MTKPLARSLPMALLALFVVGGTAHAQCAFQHPKKAGKLRANFVQAFFTCGGSYVNSITESGLPACKPPETFSRATGNDTSSGWKWDPAKAWGAVQFRVVGACAGQESPGSRPKCDPGSPLNQGPPAAADLAIKMTLTGIVRGPGAGVAPASGTGTLTTLARATLDDRTHGDVTTVDLPLSSPFTMQEGSARLKTSADALLNFMDHPGLPPCTSIALVYVSVHDPNGDTFATVGIYLPEQ